jgi:hypothetical protein
MTPTRPRGANLSPRERNAMRYLRENGVGRNMLARAFGVATSVVTRWTPNADSRVCGARSAVGGTPEVSAGVGIRTEAL